MRWTEREWEVEISQAARLGWLIHPSAVAVVLLERCRATVAEFHFLSKLRWPQFITNDNNNNGSSSSSSHSNNTGYT